MEQANLLSSRCAVLDEMKLKVLNIFADFKIHVKDYVITQPITDFKKQLLSATEQLESELNSKFACLALTLNRQLTQLANKVKNILDFYFLYTIHNELQDLGKNQLHCLEQAADNSKTKIEILYKSHQRNLD